MEDKKKEEESIVIERNGEQSISSVQDAQNTSLDVASFRKGQKTWGMRWA